MIGIIGGTGLYRMPELEILEQRATTTPFGPPSSALMIGRLAGRDVVFLARHGTQHEHAPSDINYRANIWALKQAGARTVIAVSAVGSLRSELAPGDLALPSQYIDFTRGRRSSTFFGDGLVAHISTARPSCPQVAADIQAAAAELGMPIHANRTYACVEGPRLGTRAESFMLRNAGADLVGMTNVPEVFLACEAQISYCTIALVTDYDCWLEDPAQHVTLEQTLSLFAQNLARVQRLLAAAVVRHRAQDDRPSRHLLERAIVTPRERMTAAQRDLVDVLLR
jgi:5'-methylthioadenosine phosphorylase